MDLITNLYTRSCFDSRLTFGDDCPKIIEIFVKCVYEPYYTKNGDLPSIFLIVFPAHGHHREPQQTKLFIYGLTT